MRDDTEATFQSFFRTLVRIRCFNKNQQNNVLVFYSPGLGAVQFNQLACPEATSEMTVWSLVSLCFRGQGPTVKDRGSSGC